MKKVDFNHRLKLLRLKSGALIHDDVLLEPRFGPGWLPIIESVLDQLLTLNPNGEVTIHCIKEKLAELRIYYFVSNALPRDWHDMVSDKVWLILEEAKLVSTQTCEVCGSPGKIRRSPRNGHLTLCDSHSRLFMIGNLKWFE